MGASTQHKPAHLNMLSARIARPAVRALSSTTPAGTIRSKHTLPKLPYSYDALEPAISAEIMELHHSKHHQTYVNGLNAAEEELKTAVQASDVKKAIELQRAINFNGGGHINHTLFWENLAPTKNGGGKLNDGKLDELISRDFGSVDELKKRMNAAAAGIQGSGWAWLGVDPATKKLGLSTTANQDPLLTMIPLLGIDMWEHAFCLQHQNRKPDYLANIWKVMNFDAANERLSKAL